MSCTCEQLTLEALEAVELLTLEEKAEVVFRALPSTYSTVVFRALPCTYNTSLDLAPHKSKGLVSKAEHIANHCNALSEHIADKHCSSVPTKYLVHQHQQSWLQEICI